MIHYITLYESSLVYYSAFCIGQL